jgi:hypothetical protein
MLHQSSTEIIGAGSCWLFLLLGWAGWDAAVNNTLPAKAQETYLQKLVVCVTYGYSCFHVFSQHCSQVER